MPNVRKANYGDCRDVFEWRNDELTRRMSHAKDLISWSGHCCWFKASLENTDRLIVMCEDENTNEKIAVVCFDITLDRALISINLAPKMRGKHKSKGCLDSAIALFLNNASDVRVIDAEIKSANIASRKSFISVGFEFVKAEADILFFEYVVY